mmetsp:Transcript_34040/g.76895  ORF Transcript_34040/g.76895 Transcript_34040/m.76895 type:complete len:246 (-) Transcript_34040:3-740(-)
MRTRTVRVDFPSDTTSRSNSSSDNSSSVLGTTWSRSHPATTFTALKSLWSFTSFRSLKMRCWWPGGVPSSSWIRSLIDPTVWFGSTLSVKSFPATVLTVTSKSVLTGVIATRKSSRATVTDFFVSSFSACSKRTGSYRSGPAISLHWSSVNRSGRSSGFPSAATTSSRRRKAWCVSTLAAAPMAPVGSCSSFRLFEKCALEFDEEVKVGGLELSELRPKKRVARMPIVQECAVCCEAWVECHSSE